jgi:AraC-like DNA-binding protein
MCHISSPASACHDGTVLGIASVLKRVHTTGSTLATVDRVTAFVEAELSGLVTLDRLAAVAKLSPFHFARVFKATTGLAPHQFVTARRMDRATTLLVRSSDSVEQVAHAVGLSNVSHFRRLFRSHLGVTPGAASRRQQHSTLLGRAQAAIISA